jgi:CBS domain-containing protein
MNASDIMTPGVISADPDATVLQAARYMLQHHISGVPIIDKTGKLVGILSEGDFLRGRETCTDRRPSRWLEFLMGPGKMAAEYVHTHGSKVSEVMTTEVHTVNEDTPLEKIVELMEKRRIKRVPVLQGRRHCHALQSNARDGEPGARRAESGERRCQYSPKAAGRIKEGEMGTGVHDQCRGVRWRGRIVGRDRRRTPA